MTSIKTEIICRFCCKDSNTHKIHVNYVCGLRDVPARTDFSQAGLSSDVAIGAPIFECVGASFVPGLQNEVLG